MERAGPLHLLESDSFHFYMYLLLHNISTYCMLTSNADWCTLVADLKPDIRDFPLVHQLDAEHVLVLQTNILPPPSLHPSLISLCLCLFCFCLCLSLFLSVSLSVFPVFTCANLQRCELLNS